MAAFPLGGCHRGHSHSYQGYKIAIPSHMADMMATQSHNNHIEASFGKIALSDENYKCFSNSLFWETNLFFKIICHKLLLRAELLNYYCAVFPTSKEALESYIVEVPYAFFHRFGSLFTH